MASIVTVFPNQTTEARDTYWSDYATAYDLMVENNPAYWEIVRAVMESAEQNELLAGDVILDVGAGTGNFSIALAQRHPQCHVWHVEPDAGMNQRAREKARAAGVSNLRLVISDAAAVDVPPQSVSLVVCIHSLYTFPKPRTVIRRMFDWLRPGGLVIACDLGRQMDVADWRRYLLCTLAARLGWWRTVLLAFRGRAVARANKRIARLQRDGVYWQHDLAQFTGAFVDAGFEVTQSYTCYRGYSDAIVCRRPKDQIRGAG